MAIQGFRPELIMSLLLLLGRLILAGVFGIAGIAKLGDSTGSRKSIIDFGVPQSGAIALASLLPLVELVCAVALFPLASAWFGAAGVLIVLLSFIVGISISLSRGRRPACHCFGQLHSSPSGWQTLVRNILLAGIALWIVRQGRENPGASVIGWTRGDWTRGMSGTDSMLAALSIAIAGLAAFALWALVHVLRQNGRLLLRLEAVEAK